MLISKEFFNILTCPKCKNNIELNNMFLLCDNCQLAYPVLDTNMPDMLVDNAWPLKKAQAHEFEHQEMIDNISADLCCQ